MTRKLKKKARPRKSNAGRPTVMTDDVVRKLTDAFSIGASLREAAAHAEIALSTLTSYKDRHPEFSERIDRLREKMPLKARNTIARSLDDPKWASWYLERKRKDEFSQRQEHTGSDGSPLFFTEKATPDNWPDE